MLIKPTVYLETAVIGHLVGRLHPDSIISAKQTLTRDWWTNSAIDYSLFVSLIVSDECRAGDPTAAAERLEILDKLDFLDVTNEASYLSQLLISAKAIPSSEPRDALHIAIAATNGIEYFLTWNFKHIANATLRTSIENVCRNNGFVPPLICTPEQLPRIIP